MEYNLTTTVTTNIDSIEDNAISIYNKIIEGDDLIQTVTSNRISMECNSPSTNKDICNSPAYVSESMKCNSLTSTNPIIKCNSMTTRTKSKLNNGTSFNLNGKNSSLHSTLELNTNHDMAKNKQHKYNLRKTDRRLLKTKYHPINNNFIDIDNQTINLDKKYLRTHGEKLKLNLASNNSNEVTSTDFNKTTMVNELNWIETNTMDGRPTTFDNTTNGEKNPKIETSIKPDINKTYEEIKNGYNNHKKKESIDIVTIENISQTNTEKTQEDITFQSKEELHNQIEKSSAIYDHIKETGHVIDWENSRIIWTDNISRKLLIKESLVIQAYQPELNRTTHSVPLHIYPNGIDKRYLPKFN